MNKYNFEGKTFEEVKERALYELKESDNNIIIKVIAEKNGLLKKSVTIEVIKYSDVIDYVKETLTTIINLMNLNPTFEVKRRDNSINIKIYSDNNSILIGKNGRSIQALQLLIRQMLANKITNEVLINLDEQDATKIFGTTDAMKLKSSMTLFSYAADFAEARHLQEESNGMPNLFDKSSKYRETDQIFDQVLDKFYDGQKDYSTEEILFFERPRLEMETFTPKVHK